MKRVFWSILLALAMATPANAGVTGWTSSNYLRRTSQVYDTYPFMVAVWTHRDTTGGEDVQLCIGTSGQEDHARAVFYVQSGTERQILRIRDTGNTDITPGGDPAVPDGSWFLATAELVGAAERHISLNDTNRGTGTDSVTINASDSIYIGVRCDTGEPMVSTDGLAEISIWDASGMSEANRLSLRDKLAAGENPINIKNESGQPWSNKLAAYWPLNNTTDINDQSGNSHNLSTVGTLGNHASHPTIDPVKTNAFRRRVIYVD